jgi:hypothetical protein
MCVQDFQHWLQRTKVVLQWIVLVGAYINIKQWSVSKMKTSYDICFPTLIQIMYQRNKVYCFSNRNVIFIMTMVKKKSIIRQIPCSNSWTNNYLGGKHFRPRCWKV